MSSGKHIEKPDVILIGSGVMSSHLGALIKSLDPKATIQVYESTAELARESSDGWNNAGTGHAGICELSYTPHRNPDGSVNVTKAIEIYEQFEQSRQFWGYAVSKGMIKDPKEFINPVLTSALSTDSNRSISSNRATKGCPITISSRRWSTPPIVIRFDPGRPCFWMGVIIFQSPRPKWTMEPM